MCVAQGLRPVARSVAGGAGRLVRYPAGLEQPAHDHDAPHLSLLLAGGFHERSGAAEARPDPGAAALRTGGFRHAVGFGSAGAATLTIALPPDAGLSRLGGRGWSAPLRPEASRALVRLALVEDDPALGRDLAWDLVAAALAGPRDRTPPEPWLRRARERLVEEPGPARVGELARAAGRHRVHFSRAFEAAFGLAPSVFRQRAMLDRALLGLMRGRTAVEAALDAGFADQSHMNRAFKQFLGVPPTRLRDALA